MEQLMIPSISVVVSTYNFPEALVISLESLKRQQDQDFEIIVADDGSDERTKAVIREASEGSAVSIHHVWQENEGFRLARIRNLALMQSRGDYVIFLDGDCFVLPDFISIHRQLATPGKFVSGKRSYLRRKITERILKSGVPPQGGRLSWVFRGATNQCTRLAEFIPVPGEKWRDNIPTDWKRAQMCNLGSWRSDIFKINGFDNRYIGHGLEDSDFAVRLIRSGVKRRRGDHASVVLHLEHERRRRPANSPNSSLFDAILESNSYSARSGLDELASNSYVSVSRVAPAPSSLSRVGS